MNNRLANFALSLFSTALFSLPLQAQDGDLKRVQKDLAEVRRELFLIKDDVSQIKAGVAMMMELFERSSNKRQPVTEVSFQSDRSIENDFFLGRADAPVTILAYMDYQCGFCARFYSSVLPQLLTKYVDTGKARFVFRDYLLSTHPMAALGAAIANCAGKQKKYLEATDALFANPEILAAGKAREIYSRAEGIDAAAMESCLQSAEHKPQGGSSASRKTRLDMDEAQKIGVNSTPSFFIGVTQPPGSRLNGFLLRGAREFETFSEVIDGLLKG